MFWKSGRILIFFLDLWFNINIKYIWFIWRKKIKKEYIYILLIFIYIIFKGIFENNSKLYFE